MRLYKYNEARIAFEQIPFRKLLYSLVFIVLVFSTLGFIGGFNLNTIKPANIINHLHFEKVTSELTLTDLDYKQVRLIESSGDSTAVSGEGAIGDMQIMPVTLEEWNRFHPGQLYKPQDLLSREVNLKIGKWMLAKQIPMYLKMDTIPDKLNYKLVIYNWGIGNFLKWYKDGANYSKLPEETRNYLLKYWGKY